MSDELNLPFEPVGGDPIAIDTEGHLCGGLVVRAAVASDEHGAKVPLLIFSFASADGRGMLPPIMLGIEDGAGLVQLVRDATIAAMKAARS